MTQIELLLEIFKTVSDLTIAVVAVFGLIKIVKELRTMRREDRQEKYDLYGETDNHFVNVHLAMVRDNELMGSIHHTDDSLLDLPESIKLKNYIFFHAIASMLERAYYFDENAPPEARENSEGWIHFMNLQLRNPLFRQWWKADPNNYGYNPTFKKQMNELVEKIEPENTFHSQ